MRLLVYRRPDGLRTLVDKAAAAVGAHGYWSTLDEYARRRQHSFGGRNARAAVAAPLLRLQHGRVAVRAQRQHPQPQQHPGRRLLQHRAGRGGPVRPDLGRAAVWRPPLRPQHHRVHGRAPGPRRAPDVLQVPVQLRVRAGDAARGFAAPQRLLRRAAAVLVRAVPAGPAALRHGQRLGEGRADGPQGGAGRRHGHRPAPGPRRLQEEKVQDRLLQHVDDAGDASSGGAAPADSGRAALRGAQPVGVPAGTLVPRDGLRRLLRLHHPQAVQDPGGVPHPQGAPLGAQGPRPAAPPRRHGAGRVRVPGRAHSRLAALLQRGLPAARHRHHGRRHGVPALQDVLVGLGHAGSGGGELAGGAAPGLRVSLLPHAVQRAWLPVRRPGGGAGGEQQPVRGAGPARRHPHRQPVPHHHARHALRSRAAVRHRRAVPHLPARALAGEKTAGGAQPAAHTGQPEQARRRCGGGHRHGVPLQRRGRDGGHPQGHEPGRHPGRAEAPLHAARDPPQQEHEAQQPPHLEAPRRQEGGAQKILAPGAAPPPHAELGAPPHGRGGDGGGGLAHPRGLGVLAGGALRCLQRRPLHVLGVLLRRPRRARHARHARHAQRVLQGLAQVAPAGGPSQRTAPRAVPQTGFPLLILL